MILDLAPDLVIDFEDAPWRTEGLVMFLCAKRGAGKSYTLMKTLEQCYLQGLQYIFLDPHGEGHPLAAKEFATEGRVLVASERYGVPITMEAIPIYVDLAKQGTSLILDLSKYFTKSKSKFNAFAEQFLRQLWAEWSDVRRPVFIAMDEAQYFAPQRKSSDSMSRVELVEELSTQGRKYGIHLGLSTQRSALIEKTVISQTNLRLVGKLEEENDWKAIRTYVDKTIIDWKDEAGEKIPVYLTFEDLRAFESGQFAASSAGESQIVRISKRQTVDVGATPKYEASFSKAVEIEIGEVAEQIRQAIEAARAEEERQRDLTEKLKRAEKSNEELRDQLTRLNERFETLEFISSQMSQAPADKQSAATSAEIEKVTARLDRLKGQYESEIESKEQTITTLRQDIHELERKLEPFQSFQQSLQDLISVGNNVDYSTLVEDVTSQVLTKIDLSQPTFQVSPLEALERDWERQALQTMLDKVDGLSNDALRLVSYLLKVDKYVPKKQALNAVFGVSASGGRQYDLVNAPLNQLQEIGLAENHPKSGIRATLESFIVRFLGEEPATDTMDRMREHIIQCIRERLDGGA